MAQRQRRHSCFCLNALIVVEANVFVDQIICFSARMHRAAAHAARPAARRDGIYARFYRLCSAPDAHRPSAEHRGGKAQSHVAVFLSVPQSGAACCTSSPDAPGPRASVSSWSGCSKSWTRDSKSSYTFIPPSLSSPFPRANDRRTCAGRLCMSNETNCVGLSFEKADADKNPGVSGRRLTRGAQYGILL